MQAATTTTTTITTMTAVTVAVGVTITWCGLCVNSEDRNPAGTVGGLLGDRAAAYDPTAYGGTTTLIYDERRRELVQDFVSLNGTTVELRGRHLLPAPLLAHR